MKIVQIAAATAALSVVEAHPSSASCYADKPYAVGVKIMKDSVTIGANPDLPLKPQVTAPGSAVVPAPGVHGSVAVHMNLDPVKLTFKSATTADLYWFAQADKGSLAEPTGANCKAVAACTDTVYCSPGAADTTDLTWTPPADSKTGDMSKICVFWGTTGSEVTGECITMSNTAAGSVAGTLPPGMPTSCAALPAEQKAACEAAVEKCMTDPNPVACVTNAMKPCGPVPAGKQYQNGQTATSVGTPETCFENKQTVEEGSSGATATIAVAGMMAAIAAF